MVLLSAQILSYVSADEFAQVRPQLVRLQRLPPTRRGLTAEGQGSCGNDQDPQLNEEPGLAGRKSIVMCVVPQCEQSPRDTSEWQRAASCPALHRDLWSSGSLSGFRACFNAAELSSTPCASQPDKPLSCDNAHSDTSVLSMATACTHRRPSLWALQLVWPAHARTVIR